MENTLKKYIKIEEHIASSINLLEITKGFCERNFDKSQEIAAINTILEIILSKQKHISRLIERNLLL